MKQRQVWTALVQGSCVLLCQQWKQDSPTIRMGDWLSELWYIYLVARKTAF